ncbi:MAG: hypothetical protein ACRCX2_15040 [Paraclostridium sp.]
MNNSVAVGPKIIKSINSGKALDRIVKFQNREDFMDLLRKVDYINQECQEVVYMKVGVVEGKFEDMVISSIDSECISSQYDYREHEDEYEGKSIEWVIIRCECLNFDSRLLIGQVWCYPGMEELKSGDFIISRFESITDIMFADEYDNI